MDGESIEVFADIDPVMCTVGQSYAGRTMETEFGRTRYIESSSATSTAQLVSYSPSNVQTKRGAYLSIPDRAPCGVFIVGGTEKPP